MLKGKTVVLGVSGGIAAYKVVEVVSRLVKMHADVHVIMTDNAARFVAPLTFQSISHNQVITDMFAEPSTWDIRHISLAEKADLVLIAPATANIIGKIANGIADDMLTTTVMAAKAPVLVVPAMNTAMYDNPIVQENISRLKRYGYILMEPDTGIMACGTTGRGRLPEPQVITDMAADILFPKKDMTGIRVMITAGPTREAIDPVRYISNHSSGKMGYAVAEAALLRGAAVRLVSGPVSLQPPCGAEVINTTTAVEMYNEVMKNYTDCDILIMVAAVADYRCASIADRKIKKSDEDMVIELVKNPDIARELGKVKGSRIHVGTCAETNDLVENARKKIKSKNFDLIMANDVTMEGAGFGVDTNIVKLINRDGIVRELPIMSKKEVAHELLNEVVKLMNNGQ